MSMYIIYPADQLIQQLIDNEYTIPTTTTLSPIRPPTEEFLNIFHLKNSERLRNLESSLEPRNSLEDPTTTTVGNKNHQLPIPLEKKNSAISATPTGSSTTTKGKFSSQVVVTQNRRQLVLPPSPKQPERPKRRKDKVHPLDSSPSSSTLQSKSLQVTSKGSSFRNLLSSQKKSTTGAAAASTPTSSIPPRFTFERILEEEEEEKEKVGTEIIDEFLSFRQRNSIRNPRLSPAYHIDDLESTTKKSSTELRNKKVVLSKSLSFSFTPSSPTPSIKTFKSSLLSPGDNNNNSKSLKGRRKTLLTPLAMASSSSNIISSVMKDSSGSGLSSISTSDFVGGGASGYGSGGGGSGSLKELIHPSLNESLKAQNALSFKLIRIVSDFTQQLSQLHEQHAADLQVLVETFRKRNAEIRKERPPCTSSLFQIWETLLQEVEIDSQAHSDIAGSLGRQVARQLLEKTFCRKIQSRKIFAHRESFETLLAKAETQLSNNYRDYCDACLKHIQHGNSSTLAQYYDAHNSYVAQLRGTNAMLKEYQSETLPALLQELEEIYLDLCKTLADSILHEADIISVRGQETCRRYENLQSTCRNVNGPGDLREFVKCSLSITAPNQRHAFTLPAPIIPPSDGCDLPIPDQSHVPVLKDEVVQDRIAAVSVRIKSDSLKKEMTDLESDMRQLKDSLDTLIRMQQRSLDSNLFNKANELQEEISMKMFDLRVAQMHLSSLKAQRDLFLNKTESMVNCGPELGGSLAALGIKERKMSTVAGPGVTMKSKWLKAFRSLKTSPGQPSTPVKEEKKNAKEKDSGKEFQIFENHIFQEYTYKKITPCDICSKILRGHARQGLRCRMCKTNVHFDCQEKVGKCQPKTRLLRRQRSTSELETRLSQLAEADGGSGFQSSSSQRPNDEPDLIYQVLKQATDLKKPGSSGSGSGSGGGGNGGFHGSSQTLQSGTQDYTTIGGAAGSTSAMRRSNPTVNIVGNQSGTSTPALSAAQAASFHPSSSGKRRDSYVSHKSISADADGSSIVSLPPSRAISLPSTETPHSPRRRKLDLRMKSFSLDSPESTEHAQRRRYAHGSHSTSHSQYYWRLAHANPIAYTNYSGYDNTDEIDSGPIPTSGTSLLHSRSRSTPNASTTYSPTAKQLLLDLYDYKFYSPQTSHISSLNQFAPSSPVHNRKALLSARNVRMSSVELPDENDKSLSSASTSPCPSPKPHRLLPTNLYVVLYMFKARHPDELDLKAGYKVTVTDTTDPDWWQGKCLGKIGYFPSKYVTKLNAGERPLQVTHNLQVTDGAENGLKLLRDQIVIQIGDEVDGMVTIRNGDNKQGVCPLKYLQEV